jgi:predicted nucleic acid-binding protein
MFDLRRSLRRIKPHRFTTPIRRRPREELPFVTALPESGRELLLDTCVYIDVLHGNTPPEVDVLLRLRTINHLAVCVAELTHGFGRLDPRRPGTEAITRTIAQVVGAIPAHRLEAACVEVVIEAGVLAGLVFRLCGLQPGQEVAVLNDAIIYLHALANGQTVLTRNVRDFDAMNQIMRDGRVLFYDRID